MGDDRNATKTTARTSYASLARTPLVPAARARHAVAWGLALTLTLAPLSGCASSGTAGAGTPSSSTSATSATSSAATASDDTPATTPEGGVTVIDDAADAFSDRDLSGDYDDRVVSVALADDGTTADGSGVSADGQTVTISEEGTYVLSGTLADGQVVVDAPDDAKVQLVLDGASVTNSSGAAVLVEAADKCFLTVAEGSDNTLASTGGLDGDDKVDGAVFSRSDLTINGTGTLSVSSVGHGVVCKDDLVLVGASATIVADGSAVQANDSIAVASGNWALDAGSDCLHAENEDDSSKGWVYVAGGSVDMAADDDGIHASGAVQVDGGAITASVSDDAVHAEWELAVNGGTIDITACYEGLEGSKVYVAGGTTSIVSSDDALNAVGDPDSASSSSDTTSSQGGPGGWGSMAGNDSALVAISGGTLRVTASGDGIDSNGDLTVTGGEVYVSGPTSGGDGSLDYGEGCSATISGGTVLCAGSSGMAETFGSDSTQPSALVSLAGSAGDTITVTDADGTTLVSMEAGTTYQCVVASAPGMEVGGTYTVSNGTDSVEVTFDSVTYSNVTGGFGGFGGFGGGGFPQGGPGQTDGSTGTDDSTGTTDSTGDGTDAPSAPQGDGSMPTPPGGGNPPGGLSAPGGGSSGGTGNTQSAAS